MTENRYINGNTGNSHANLANGEAERPISKLPATRIEAARFWLTRISQISAIAYGVVAPLSIAASNLMFGIGVGVLIVRETVLWQSGRNRKARLKDFPGMKLLALFILWNLLSAVLSETPRESFRVATGVYTWLFAIWSFFVFGEPEDDEYASRLMLWFSAALAVGLIVNTAYSIYHQAQPYLRELTDLKEIQHARRPSGWLTNALTWSQIAMLGGFWIWKSASALRMQRALCLPAMVAACIGVVTSLTRSAWGASLLIAIALANSFKARVAAVAGAIALFFVAQAVNPFAISRVQAIAAQLSPAGVRRTLWDLAIEMTVQQPVFGFGPGMFRWYFEQVYPVAFYHRITHGHPHSTILMAASETGLVGAFLLVVLMLRWMQSLRRRQSEDARLVFWLLVGFHLVGLVEANFYDAEPSMLMAFLFGIVVSRTRERDDPRRSNRNRRRSGGGAASPMESVAHA